MPNRAQRKRGRPPKFGRAADLISLTLPRDVITWLESIDDDLAWAIVKLHERSTRARVGHVESAQLVRFPGDRALIIVKPELFDHMSGVSLIPLSDGRAFLALENGKGVEELEAQLKQSLEASRLDAAQRAATERLMQLLLQWREEGIWFESRAIVVAHKRLSASLPAVGARTRSARKASD